MSKSFLNKQLLKLCLGNKTQLKIYKWGVRGGWQGMWYIILFFISSEVEIWIVSAVYSLWHNNSSLYLYDPFQSACFHICHLKRLYNSPVWYIILFYGWGNWGSEKITEQCCVQYQPWKPAEPWLRLGMLSRPCFGSTSRPRWIPILLFPSLPALSL